MDKHSHHLITVWNSPAYSGVMRHSRTFSPSGCLKMERRQKDIKFWKEINKTKTKRNRNRPWIFKKNEEEENRRKFKGESKTNQAYAPFIPEAHDNGPIIEYLIRHYFGKEAGPIGRLRPICSYCPCPTYKKEVPTCRPPVNPLCLLAIKATPSQPKNKTSLKPKINRNYGRYPITDKDNWTLSPTKCSEPAKRDGTLQDEGDQANKEVEKQNTKKRTEKKYEGDTYLSLDFFPRFQTWSKTEGRNKPIKGLKTKKKFQTRRKENQEKGSRQYNFKVFQETKESKA